jgi:hypothetical protein
MGGGFLGASARVTSLDLDVCGSRRGRARQKGRGRRGRVYASGVANLSGPVSLFVTYLANGGRAPVKTETDGTGEA